MNRFKRYPTFPQRFVIVVALTGLIVISAAVIFLWRPAEATNDPFRERIADWTIESIDSSEAFVGYGIFYYRPEWGGPAQSFDGPVLMRIDDSDAPVQMHIEGDFTIARGADSSASELSVRSSQSGSAQPTDLTLEPGDTLSLAPQTTFSVVTGKGEAVRIFAVTITPTSPPATPGIEQVEWRAWGDSGLPATPFVVSIADLQLAGGEAFSFTRSGGPELLALDGAGTGSTSIGVRVSTGSGFYEKIGSSAAWNLVSPFAVTASQTAFTTNRERSLEIGSGAFLAQGTSARIRNSSLVDGNAVRMIAIGAD